MSNKKAAEDFVRKAIADADAALARDDSRAAWASLVDAHIVSQPYAWLHTVVHFRMFCLGFRERDMREIIGQTARLVLASPGSWSKRYPLGNTGRSDVSMFEPMEVPEHLRSRIDEAS